jgi:glycosyltransferase involved in cell wall biosynthesis
MPQLLSINNYYYRRGGSEAVFLEHNRLFEEAGWTVIPFAMQDAKNLPTPWAQYFPGAVELAGSQPFTDKVAAAAKLVYSLEAARRIRQLLRTTRPTIAHAHNIYHHLSPSVLVELHRQQIPSVLTLHDLKIACPAYKMFTNGNVCERCRGGALRNVVIQRCIKGSTFMSALIWLESTVHRMMDIYQKNVTQFIVPSRFFLSKMHSWGFDTSRFTYIPNFVHIDSQESHTTAVGDTFVYLGRLVPEKGVATLIRAAARAGVKLVIAGTGPDEASLQELAAQCGGDIRFAGHVSGSELRQTIASARAVVVPSEWYENAPMSLMEAYAVGRPVIGARIGGIPELIREGETGFLFESGDVESLADALARVREHSGPALSQMGRAAREWMQAEFTPALYRDRMLALYGAIETAA